MPIYNVDTTADEVANDCSDQITSKTVLITGVGANSLGGDVARVIALHDPKLLILSGRSEAKISDVKKILLKTSPTLDIRVLVADLASLKSVRKAAEEVKSYATTLDAIINVAGVMAVPEFTLTEDKVELSFQANYLGHFLLTNLLMALIIKTQGAVVNVTSEGHLRAESINVEDVNYNNGTTYHKWAAYAHSKAACILFSVALASKIPNTKVRAFTVDPGVVLSTSLTRSIPQEEFKELGWVDEHGNLNLDNFTPVLPAQGSAGMIVGAFDKSIAESNGSVIAKSHIDNTAAAPYALDKATAEKLWSTSEKLVGQRFSY